MTCNEPTTEPSQLSSADTTAHRENVMPVINIFFLNVLKAEISGNIQNCNIRADTIVITSH